MACLSAIPVEMTVRINAAATDKYLCDGSERPWRKHANNLFKEDSAFRYESELVGSQPLQRDVLPRSKNEQRDLRPLSLGIEENFLAFTL